VIGFGIMSLGRVGYPFLVAAVGLLGGCAAGSVPAEPLSDAAAAEGSSSTTFEAGSTSQQASGEAGALVAQCQDLARQFAATCASEAPPDANRACLWTAYVHLCATGNTKLLLDSMNCLEGKNPSCWTFGDCNDSCACLGAVHQAEESPAARGFIEKECQLCGATMCDVVTGQADMYPYLPDSIIAAFDACLDGACVASDAGAHCGSVWPESKEFICGQ
jgi:hypothetical protein